MKQDINIEIKIPENVEINVNENIHVKGEMGELSKKFKNADIKKKEDKIIISKKNATKNDKKFLGTVAAHIKNMILGVSEGYEYKLQICSVHFPMTVNFDSAKKILAIKNFLGENRERKTNILENVDIKIEGDIITVFSADKEAAGQTAANIETLTKIKSKDIRVFQDGIYIISKPSRRGL